MKTYPAICAALCAFAMLIIFPDTAKDAVTGGLETCGGIIIPSLFPYFVAVNLIIELGVIGRLFRALHIKNLKYASFIIGITGGYPVGAAYIAETRKRGELSCDDASKMLVYCNNSGPAFIIGAVGSGVFHSTSAGLVLYAAHMLSAAVYGKLFCHIENSEAHFPDASEKTDFAPAFTASVRKSVSSIINVCGFVLAFSVIISLINSGGLIYILSGKMSELINTELHFNASLISGLFEIGNSIKEMQFLAVSPLNLALAAFVLGWGGISVHFQTFSIISDTDIKTARYVIGRLIIAIFAAITVFLTAAIFRIFRI